MKSTAMLGGLLVIAIVGAGCPEREEEETLNTAFLATECPPASTTPPPTGGSTLPVFRADTVIHIGSDSAMVVGADSERQCIVIVLAPTTGPTHIQFNFTP